jgi:2-polyprenyl-3-methyl-5-hydroxy-6-metoxy-1,4-benzoquinol methylase
MRSENVVGNYYDKYGTKNPIARALMNGFLSAVSALYRRAAPRRVLEVGCGEGRLAHHLVTRGSVPDAFEACDVSIDRVAPGLHPLIQFRQASIYELPFEDRSFDLVVCCEVLEHLEEPAKGLREVARVSAGHVLLSTPREPIWRALNMLRGKYLSDLGNTPGHIQHWSSHGLTRFAEREVQIVERRRPLPWTVLLGTPRR